MAKQESKQADAKVQKAVDAETEQGYRGIKVDPLPNSAYSLESGPDAPTVDATGRVEQADFTELGAK